jgi:hypothetical protein
MAESLIDVWHGFGRIIGKVSHDGESGNAVGSFFEAEFVGGESARITVEHDAYGSLKKFALSFLGGCERDGMAQFLRCVADELDKPAEKLGGSYYIGYEPFEEEEGTLSIKEKGKIGEAQLNAWLKSIGISYVYLDQSQDTFSDLFKGNVKRPDFLVLLESIGLIAVDAKNYTLTAAGEYTLPLETELKRVLAFERLFRIPVWYAYMGKDPETAPAWYWISALKALEVGHVRKNSVKDEDYLAIKLEHFERIEKMKISASCTHTDCRAWSRIPRISKSRIWSTCGERHGRM